MFYNSSADIKHLAMGLAVALFFIQSPAANADDLKNCRPFTAEIEASLQGRTAVVTDIDGVLTQYIKADYGLTDGAFLDQGVAYPRENAALLMNLYQRKGYLIIYMAGRPRNLEITGKTSCAATLDWLQANGFPTQEGGTLLLLSDGPTSVLDAKNRGHAMADWMGEQGTQMFQNMLNPLTARYAIDLAYGYADSDVVTDAFIDSGVSAGNIFTIGNRGMSRLGYRGSNAIMGPEAETEYTSHIKEFVVPEVPVLK